MMSAQSGCIFDKYVWSTTPPFSDPRGRSIPKISARTLWITVIMKENFLRTLYNNQAIHLQGSQHQQEKWNMVAVQPDPKHWTSQGSWIYLCPKKKRRQRQITLGRRSSRNEIRPPINCTRFRNCHKWVSALGPFSSTASCLIILTWWSILLKQETEVKISAI